MNKKARKIMAITMLSVVVFVANKIGVAKASFSDYVAFASDAVNRTSSTSLSPASSATVGDQYLVPSGKLSPEVAKANFKIKMWSEEIIVEASGYSSTPDQTKPSDPFTMANGHRVHDGAIAANVYLNGKKISFGTFVKIPEIYGNKIFVVEDRMNSRYTNNIDFWFPDRQSALDFGRKMVKIQVINL